jgi:hypothetical protein
MNVEEKGSHETREVPLVRKKRRKGETIGWDMLIAIIVLSTVSAWVVAFWCDIGQRYLNMLFMTSR